MVAAEQSEFGWAVVSRHDASEQDGDLEERVVLGDSTHLVVRKLVDKSIISYCLAAGFILSQVVQCRVQDSVINSS